MARQVTEPSSEVPDHIRPNHLIKELTKEIRYLEVRGEGTGAGTVCMCVVASEAPCPISKTLSSPSCLQEEPVPGSKPVKSQGSGCVAPPGPGPNGCPATRSTLERLCQARRARRARRAARRLREQQQQQAPKAPSNLDILERHTREVLRRLEVGPLEEVSPETKTSK